MSALLPLHLALLDRLTTDAALMQRLAAVYEDQAPLNAALPHLVVGSTTEVQRDVFGTSGYTDTVTLSLYSNARTRTEALELAGLVDLALARPLFLDGHLAASLRREFREVLVEEGGIRHVPVRYRISTFEVAL